MTHHLIPLLKAPLLDEVHQSLEVVPTPNGDEDRQEGNGDVPEAIHAKQKVRQKGRRR
jgi:hypothetical protein